MTVQKRTMSGPSFLAHLQHVGLADNLSEAARFLGISRAQLYRIMAGDYPAPKAIVLLLLLMVAKDVGPAWFDRRLGR